MTIKPKINHRDIIKPTTFDGSLFIPEPSIDEPEFSVTVFTLDEFNEHSTAWYDFDHESWVFPYDSNLYEFDLEDDLESIDWKWYYPPIVYFNENILENVQLN